MNLTDRSGNRTQDFIYDGNVAGLIGGAYDPVHFYMQDELGSPVRVTKDSEEYIPDEERYLTYGYDEYGNGLYEDTDEAFIQPFGYTGYRYDETVGTYFAQAREYRPEDGRFGGVDWIKGNTDEPITQNSYVYCWNKVTAFVDLDGKEVRDAGLNSSTISYFCMQNTDKPNVEIIADNSVVYYYYDPLMWYGTHEDNYGNEEPYNLSMKNIVSEDMKILQDIYFANVIPIEMNGESNSLYTSFTDSWNSMDDEKNIKAVVINTHSNKDYFVSESKALDNKRVTVKGVGINTEKYTVVDTSIAGLENKKINSLYLLGCNMGAVSSEGSSIAEEFLKNVPGIERVIASDTQVFTSINGGRGVYSKRYRVDIYGQKYKLPYNGFMLFTRNNTPQQIDISEYLIGLSDQGREYE